MARFLLSARSLQCDINLINSWIVLCCICLSCCLTSPAKVLFLWTFLDSLYQARRLARKAHLWSHMGQTRLVSDCQQFLTKEGCELLSWFLIRFLIRTYASVYMSQRHVNIHIYLFHSTYPFTVWLGPIPLRGGVKFLHLSLGRDLWPSWPVESDRFWW